MKRYTITQPKTFEWIFVVVSLIMITGGFTQNGILPRIPITLIRLAAVAISFFYIYKDRHLYLKLITIDRVFFVFCAYSAVSLLWSVNFLYSLDSVIWFLLIVAFAMYMSVRYTLVEIVQLLFFTLLVSAILSIIFLIIMPNSALMVEGNRSGALRGIFEHKQNLSKFMGMGLILSIFFFRYIHKSIFLQLASIALFGYTLLAAEGVTSLLAAVVMVPFVAFLTLRAWRHLAFAGLLILAVLATIYLGALVVANLSSILDTLGRNPTLSSRLPIWEVSWYLIQERLWFGYGLEAALVSSLSLDVNLQWQAVHAHNGWLDLWLSFGIVGLSLFVFTVLRSVWRGLVYTAASGETLYTFPIAYLMYVLVHSFSTSPLVTTPDLIFTLYVVVQLKLGLEFYDRSKQKVKRLVF